MPTAAERFTAAQVAAFPGGIDAIWEELFKRLWVTHLKAVRDGRAYVVQFVKQTPTNVPGTNPAQTEFSVRGEFILADPLKAVIGERVDSNFVHVSEVLSEGPPLLARVGARKFIKLDEKTWERSVD